MPISLRTLTGLSIAGFVIVSGVLGLDIVSRLKSGTIDHRVMLASLLYGLSMVAAMLAIASQAVTLARKYATPGIRQLLRLTPMEDSEIVSAFVLATLFKLRIGITLLIPLVPLIITAPIYEIMAATEGRDFARWAENLPLAFLVGVFLALATIALLVLATIDGVFNAFNVAASRRGELRTISGTGMLAAGATVAFAFVICMASRVTTPRDLLPPLLWAGLCCAPVPMLLSARVYLWARGEVRKAQEFMLNSD